MSQLSASWIEELFLIKRIRFDGLSCTIGIVHATGIIDPFMTKKKMLRRGAMWSLLRVWILLYLPISTDCGIGQGPWCVYTDKTTGIGMDRKFSLSWLHITNLCQRCQCTRLLK